MPLILNGTPGGTAIGTATPGAILQIVNYQTGAVANGSTQIPTDDTIPQNTEGNQYMSLAITPLSASSKLRIQTVAYGTTNSGAGTATMALFRDSIASALAAALFTHSATGYLFPLTIDHIMSSPGTSATTFKVRIGPNTAIAYVFNGASDGTSRYFGGVMSSTITITEYMP